MFNFDIDFSYFTDIFGYLYNFFATLINVIQLPFNDPFAQYSFKNPYFDVVVNGGISHEDLPTWVLNIMTALTDTFDKLFNIYLQPFGVDTSYPFWIVLICLLPAIFGLVIIANIIYKLFAS